MDRLTYVTDFLGLTRFEPGYLASLWRTIPGNIFKDWNSYTMEPAVLFSCDITEIDLYLQDRWIQEFCNNVPDRKIRKELKELVKKIYKEKGMEIPGRAGII